MLVLYIQPLSNLIKRHYLSVHLFADDIHFETSIFPQHVHSAISSVETCISDVRYWMIENNLQLNDAKTECLLIRQNKCPQNLNRTSLSFGHNVISLSSTAKTSDSILQMTCELTRMYKTSAARLTLTYDALAPFVTFSLLMQQKLSSAPL